MTRRTKQDMEFMKNDCIYYLLQTNNDYHKAYDLFIKEHLENGKTLPYYIKGNKDFLFVSQQLAVEWNRKEQMDNKNKEIAEKKDVIINYILNMSKDEIKAIYKQYKNEVSPSEKIILVDVYTLIFNDAIEERNIGQNYINLFDTIYQEQLQTV